jgi:hypothetical protein
MYEGVRSIDPETALGFSTREVPQCFFEERGPALRAVCEDESCRQITGLLGLFTDINLRSVLENANLFIPIDASTLPSPITCFLEVGSSQPIEAAIDYNKEPLEISFCPFEEQGKLLRKVILDYSSPRRGRRQLARIGLGECNLAQNGDEAVRVVLADISGQKIVRIQDFRSIKRDMGIKTFLGFREDIKTTQKRPGVNRELWLPQYKSVGEHGRNFPLYELDEIVYEWRQTDGLPPKICWVKRAEYIKCGEKEIELSTDSVGGLDGLSLGDFRRMPGIDEVERMLYPMNYLRESFPPDWSLFPQ